MIHLQAQDYSIPWADEAFLEEYGPIAGRKCYEIMHGRDKPCVKCPTFEAFETRKNVISEWHRKDGRKFMTVVEPLPNDLPLLVEYAVEI